MRCSKAVNATEAAGRHGIWMCSGVTKLAQARSGHGGADVWLAAAELKRFAINWAVHSCRRRDGFTPKAAATRDPA